MARRLLQFVPVALCACVLISTPARGGDWLRQASWLPDDVDIVFIIDNAASLRTAPAGDAIGAMLTSFLTLSTTPDAWRALSAHLDLPPDEAFDTLLGDRLIFVADGFDAPEMAWAILSDVDTRTAIHLLKKLGALPRDIAGGRPIANIEQGRFQLTYHKQGRRSTMLLAPREHAELFLRISSRMGGGEAGSLAQSEDFRTLARSAPANATALLYQRFELEHPVWMGAAAVVDGLTIEASMLASAPELRSGVTEFTNEQWLRFSDGAALAFVELIEFDHMPIPGALPRQLADNALGWLKEHLNGRIALRLKRTAFGGPMAITVAAETADVDRLAPVGDQLMASLASALSIMQRQTPDPQQYNLLSGEFPEAVRSIRLTGERVGANPLGGGELELHWTYQRLHRRGEPAPNGWWIVATDREHLDQANSALAPRERAAPPDAPEPSAISFMEIHPEALLRMLIEIGVGLDDLPPPVAAFGWIDHIVSEASLDGDLVRGVTRITLRDAPPDVSSKD